MSLGEIIGAGSRVYYRLENTNDAGPNGYNLTNNNSVAFNVGKFTNSADFGSTGTNKGLTYAGANVLSSLEPTDVSVSFWYKLNDATTSNGNARFFELTTASNNAAAMRIACFYNISAGNITITAFGQGVTSATVTVAADTNWHHILFRKISTNQMIILYDIGTSGTAASGAHTTSAFTLTYYLTIGNTTSTLTQQVFAMIDEFYIYEKNLGTDYLINKYYTQAKGRFCI